MAGSGGPLNDFGRWLIPHMDGRNVDWMMARLPGVNNAPPTPCSSRNTISELVSHAIAHSSDAIANHHTPQKGIDPLLCSCVNLAEALKVSCNCYFAWLGEQYPSSRSLRLMANTFGFGQPTGLRRGTSRRLSSQRSSAASAPSA